MASPARMSPPPVSAVEGDTNTGDPRAEFVASHLDEATRALLRRDEAVFLGQALSTPCLNVLRGAEGTCITDWQSRQMLDFHGNAVHHLGHGNARVLEAIREQLDQLAFCPRRYTNLPAIELAEKLTRLAPVRLRPGDTPKLLFAPGGAEAISMAMHVARRATGRFKLISMWDSFHGATLDAISVGGESLFRKDLGPLLPGVHHVPPFGSSDIESLSADYVDYVLKHEGDIAAVLVEPMRWTSVRVPTREYWKSIRQSCDRHGALLIVDEIPSCLGRTGRMFCIEHFGVEPDMLVIGKGLGGGVFPLAAVICASSFDVGARTAIGHFTHEKSPVAAAAGLAVLRTLQDQQLVSRAADLGRSARDMAQSLASRRDAIVDVRGLGLHLGVELRSPEAATLVLYECLRRGLSFKIGDAKTLVLSPPLTVTEQQLALAFEILDRSLAGLEVRVVF